MCIQQQTMLAFGSLDIYQVSVQLEHQVPLLVLASNANVFAVFIGYKNPLLDEGRFTLGHSGTAGHDLSTLGHRLMRSWSKWPDINILSII
jgi:hypothetical protein